MKQTLQEQLKSEVRTCPQCHYQVDNPFIGKCPRCFSSLPQIKIDCEGCIHRFLCPIQKNRKLIPQ